MRSLRSKVVRTLREVNPHNLTMLLIVDKFTRYEKTSSHRGKRAASRMASFIFTLLS